MGAIAHLNDYQLQKGMRRVVFSGKATALSLPEFVKLCRTVGHSDEVPDVSPPTAQQALTHEDQEFDNWAMEANQHFLAYVLRKLSEKRCFNPDETRILVRFKNLWADQMRLSATTEGVPIEEQKDVWSECIRRAEEEIAHA